MERIVIEVADSTAKKWQLTSSKFKQVLLENFAANVDFVIETYNNENFIESLNEIGELLASRGLTQEKVDEILNSND
jgi:hypothetical protein